jgi:DNA-binding transcriptional LysR family regulator
LHRGRPGARGTNVSVSLLQLESFVAVAEEGHVGRAARRLHVTQPPLTRRIRSLEDELGVRLFARTRSGMRLLPEGEALLGHARAILRQVQRARRAVASRRDRPPPSG